MIKETNYKKRVIIIIITFSTLRLFLSAFLELGNDESYYWVYSQYLQWNYFDHPPMVALWTRLFTCNLLLQDYTLFLRLGSVISCALATWVLYKTVLTLGNERGGYIAACLYNASFYAGITAGIFVMPDAPQMLFWALSLLMIAKISIESDNWRWWILLGVFAGLSIMSKVHGIYIWGGFGFYILFFNRSLLKNKYLYISVLITSIIILPILWWNIENNFVTYRFHSERIIIHGYLFNIENFFKELLSELVVNNPVNVLLTLSALFSAKHKNLRNNGAFKTFNFIGFSLIIVVLFLSLFRDTRPIWSGPGYISLIPITAMSLTMTENSILKFLRRLSPFIFIILALGAFMYIELLPGTSGNHQKTSLGKGDITLDMYGWEAAGKEFSNIYKRDIDNGLASPGSPLICNTWWGAHEEYYFCRPLHIQMIGLGNVMDLHQYMWTNYKRRAEVNMNTAYCIIHSDENFNVHPYFDQYYKKIDTVNTIHIQRRNAPAHDFYILRFSVWANNLPMIY